MPEKICFKVSGKVQGVCFRAYAQAAAVEIDVTGWVRNMPDGCVEGEGWGTAEAIEEFVKWLHKGSPHGRVDHVEITRLGTEDQRPPSFGVKY